MATANFVYPSAAGKLPWPRLLSSDSSWRCEGLSSVDTLRPPVMAVMKISWSLAMLVPEETLESPKVVFSIPPLSERGDPEPKGVLGYQEGCRLSAGATET